MVNILEGVGLSATARLPDDNYCKTFVVAVHANGGGVECLRTYSSENGRATDCTIIEAARATSAAPTYFDAITITFPSTNTRCVFLDGGVGHNNPSPLALTEANGIWPGRTIKLLLSIGTGVAPPVRYKAHSRFNRLKAAIEAAKLASEIATQCGITHEDLLRKRDLSGKYMPLLHDVRHVIELQLLDGIHNSYSRLELVSRAWGRTLTVGIGAIPLQCRFRIEHKFADIKFFIHFKVCSKPVQMVLFPFRS